MKGQSAIVATIVGIVISAIALVIGLVVYASFSPFMRDVYTASADFNDTFDNIENYSYDAFSVGAAMPLILFAAVIIGVVLGARRIMGGSEREYTGP